MYVNGRRASHVSFSVKSVQWRSATLSSLSETAQAGLTFPGQPLTAGRIKAGHDTNTPAIHGVNVWSSKNDVVTSVFRLDDTEAHDPAQGWRTKPTTSPGLARGNQVRITIKNDNQTSANDVVTKGWTPIAAAGELGFQRCHHSVPKEITTRHPCSDCIRAISTQQLLCGFKASEGRTHSRAS